jgi:hypothetical protein
MYIFINFLALSQVSNNINHIFHYLLLSSSRLFQYFNLSKNACLTSPLFLILDLIEFPSSFTPSWTCQESVGILGMPKLA